MTRLLLPLLALLGGLGCVVRLPGADDTPAPTDDTVETDTVDTDVEETDDTDVEASGIRVLLLGDGGSEAAVGAALRAAGHAVTDAGAYDAWDGATPAATDHDVVVFLQAATFNRDLSRAADAALIDFVEGGGGLIRTERAAYAASETQPMDLDAWMPVRFANDYEDAVDWWAKDRTHVLLTGLPGKWNDLATYTKVTAVPEATIVVETQRGVPLVTYRTDLGGTYLHLNHDLTQTAPELGEEFRLLLSNAVEFVAP